jgi:hypothetical protein
LSLRAAILDVASPAWADVLSRVRHDFYHLPAYLALSARMENGQAAALLIEDGASKMLLPFVRRAIPGGLGFDGTSPYGYPAPLFTDPAAQAASFVRDGWSAGLEALRDAGIVSLFVRMHPLLDAPLEALRAFGTIVEHGPTVSIDLRLSDAEAWAAMRSTTKHELRRAERDGQRAFRDDDWAHVEDFRRLYGATMSRVGASQFYKFPEAYFSGLREALGSMLHLWVVEIDDKIVAASLITEVAGLVQYHLSGSDSAYAKRQPTKFLLESVRRWARARENHDFHLGGGLGSAEDSLFFFKAGFSARRHTFRSWRVVVDRARYGELSKRAGAGASIDSHEGFFPAYRCAPIHSPEESAERRAE